jgi:hypothetical protein
VYGIGRGETKCKDYIDDYLECSRKKKQVMTVLCINNCLDLSTVKVGVLN